MLNHHPAHRGSAPQASSVAPAPSPRLTPPTAHSPSPAMSGFEPTPLAWLMAAAFMALSPAALAQPVGAQVVAGQASFQQQGNQLIVTTLNAAGTQHSAINWQSFNVPAGSTTWFNQPNASSTSINRVMAPNPSSIMGTLGSNGHLVLVNPSGITVGAGAVVDTARFTAAAMTMSDADAVAGRLRFEGGSSVDVQGQVLARGGDVLLLAPQTSVQAGALVQAPNGAVMLAAGQKVEVMSPGLDGLRFEVQAPADAALNLGTLQGNAVGMFASSLKHSGQIEVQAVRDDGGQVILKAKDQAVVDGLVRAQRLARLGGLFEATARTVAVSAQAHIDASGAAGGGSIWVGGGWQGQNPALANAQTTTVARGAVLDASATERGNGGTVAVWSDGQTQFAGQILARGGPQGGDGGQVETSGKQHLTLGGQVDTRAPAGHTGTWLLDPTNLVIAGGAAPTTGGPAADTVYEADLEASTSNVSLSAENITVAGTFGRDALSMPSGLDIKLATTGTGGGIDLWTPDTTPVGIALETGGSGSITLLATGASQTIRPGTMATSGGAITVSASGQLDLGHVVIESNGGPINLLGGSLGQSAGAGIRVHDGTRIDAATGDVTLSGTSYVDPGVSIEATPITSHNTTISGRNVLIVGTTGMGSTALQAQDALINATQSLNLQATDGQLSLQNSTVQNSGAGGLNLRAQGQYTAQQVAVDAASTVSNLGGTSDIQIQADQVQIDGMVNAGTTARVVIRPDTSTRAITLGGTDEIGALNLTAAELSQLTAKTVVVGWGGASGGIQVKGPIVMAPAAAPELSLLQSSSGSIGQDSKATLSVQALNADAGTVALLQANNVQQISGRSHTGSFQFASASTAGLQVGTVDGVNGVVAGDTTTPQAMELAVTSPGASLTTTGGPLQGSNITLTGPGTASPQEVVTVGDVTAQGTLSFAGWKSAQLTGQTQFDHIQFPNGLIQTMGGSLNPGGTDRLVDATINVGQMDIDPTTAIKIDFSGATHDTMTFPATAGISFGSGYNLVLHEMATIPDGSYAVATRLGTTPLTLIQVDVNTTTPPPPPPPPAPAPTPAPAAVTDVVSTFLALYVQELDKQQTQPGGVNWVQAPKSRRSENPDPLVGEGDGEVCR